MLQLYETDESSVHNTLKKIILQLPVKKQNTDGITNQSKKSEYVSDKNKWKKWNLLCYKSNQYLIAVH